jgi:hypothetical protein
MRLTMFFEVVGDMGFLQYQRVNPFGGHARQLHLCIYARAARKASRLRTFRRARGATLPFFVGQLANVLLGQLISWIVNPSRRNKCTDPGQSAASSGINIQLSTLLLDSKLTS